MPLFKDLSSGLARFVYAWIVPSATSVAVFVLFVLPDLRRVLGGGVLNADGTLIGSAALFATTVLILSVLFAYTALPAYRLLEGYTLPQWLKRRLLSRQMRHWYRLQALSELATRPGASTGLSVDDLNAYPSSVEDVLPTRLGNALRAMERYGVERFGLDSQLLWYELQSITSPTLRRDTEDARASVDFFLAGVVHASLLCLVSTCVAAASLVTRSPLATGSVCVALISLVLIPLSYREAVRNVEEWRSAVQALVNVGRDGLFTALGFRKPMTFRQEREFWNAYRALVVYGPDDDSLRYLDTRRAKSAN
jgi:hypothetical protein